MRALAVAAGLLFGIGVAGIGGCDRLCESRSSLATGSYAIDDDERSSSNFAADGYALTVADDRATVTERFRVGEKRYELTYAVTRAMRH
ncbi:MAG: hypothetical protein JWN44_6469 [Myxococcales bacterium]|nr:hypothetical protein [Myxococcales bacterium]